MIVKRGSFALALYVLASVPFFALVALPVLQGRMDFQFYADSPTYHAAAETMDLGLELVSVGANYLGPLLIVRTFGGSFALIYLFNVALFVLTYVIVVRSFPVNRVRFLFIMFIAPLTFTSLFSVNKEVLAVFVTILFAASYARGKPAWRYLALGLSILARWQMTAALLAATLALSRVNPLRRHRLVTLACLIGALSVLYPLNLSTFEHVSRVAELGSVENVTGSGLFTRFIEIQNRIGGYLAVFVPKAIHLFVGLVRRYGNLFDTSEVMNSTIMWFQSVAHLIVLLWMIGARRMRLASDRVYIALVIAALIGLSPIFATRYLLPVYVLFAIELAIPRRQTAQQPAAAEAAA